MGGKKCQTWGRKREYRDRGRSERSFKDPSNPGA